MPEMPAIRSSIGWVIRFSTTLADAPLYDVRIVTIGGSMFGYSRRGRRLAETSPSAIKRRPKTDASTGRLIDVSERNMGLLPQVDVAGRVLPPPPPAHHLISPERPADPGSAPSPARSAAP